MYDKKFKIASHFLEITEIYQVIIMRQWILVKIENISLCFINEKYLGSIVLGPRNVVSMKRR